MEAQRGGRISIGTFFRFLTVLLLLKRATLTAAMFPGILSFSAHTRHMVPVVMEEYHV